MMSSSVSYCGSSSGSSAGSSSSSAEPSSAASATSSSPAAWSPSSPEQALTIRPNVTNAAASVDLRMAYTLRLLGLVAVLDHPAGVTELDLLPDPVHDLDELRCPLELERARSRKLDGDGGPDGARACAEYDHAVGEVRRLVDLVGDEQDSLVPVR